MIKVDPNLFQNLLLSLLFAAARTWPHSQWRSSSCCWMGTSEVCKDLSRIRWALAPSFSRFRSARCISQDVAKVGCSETSLKYPQPCLFFSFLSCPQRTHRFIGGVGSTQRRHRLVELNAGLRDFSGFFQRLSMQHFFLCKGQRSTTELSIQCHHVSQFVPAKPSPPGMEPWQKHSRFAKTGRSYFEPNNGKMIFWICLHLFDLFCIVFCERWLKAVRLLPVLEQARSVAVPWEAPGTVSWCVYQSLAEVAYILQSWKSESFRCNFLKCRTFMSINEHYIKKFCEVCDFAVFYNMLRSSLNFPQTSLVDLNLWWCAACCITNGSVTVMIVLVWSIWLKEYQPRNVNHCYSKWAIFFARSSCGSSPSSFAARLRALDNAWRCKAGVIEHTTSCSCLPCIICNQLGPIPASSTPAIQRYPEFVCVCINHQPVSKKQQIELSEVSPCSDCLRSVLQEVGHGPCWMVGPCQTKATDCPWGRTKATTTQLATGEKKIDAKSQKAAQSIRLKSYRKRFMNFLWFMTCKIETSTFVFCWDFNSKGGPRAAATASASYGCLWSVQNLDMTASDVWKQKLQIDADRPLDDTCPDLHSQISVFSSKRSSPWQDLAIATVKSMVKSDVLIHVIATNGCRSPFAWINTFLSLATCCSDCQARSSGYPMLSWECPSLPRHSLAEPVKTRERSHLKTARSSNGFHLKAVWELRETWVKTISFFGTANSILRPCEFQQPLLAHAHHFLS